MKEEPNFIVNYNQTDYEVHLSKCIIRYTTFTGRVIEKIICEFNNALYLVEEDDKFPMILPFQTAYFDYGEQDV